MRAAALILCLVAATPASAMLADRQLPARAAEAEARALMGEIRCVQCQGQAVGDSDAPIARAMRHEIRTRIGRGERPDAVRAWLVTRYGDYVRYDPPLTAATALLWAAPLLLLGLGALVAWRMIGRRG